MQAKDQKQLINWYEKNKRDLPWRKNHNPYYIWISETMLQQTTTTAVIPFFKKFILNFPTLEELAAAPIERVLENWAGLGYYSRARNLHKAANTLAEMDQFPQCYSELIKLPGFGPYTSRSVTSIAFDQNVGVLDGNVIRVLCRKNNLKVEWWKTSGRNQLQELADHAVKNTSARTTNQALMELGATICLPKNPQCFLCPWNKSCEALKHSTMDQLPIKKPKKESEIWIWRPQVIKKSGKIALIKNDYAPFLKDQWFLPGKTLKAKSKPKTYDFKHAITHHNIYVQVQDQTKNWKSLYKEKDLTWVKVTELKKWTPSSLVAKIFE